MAIQNSLIQTGFSTEECIKFKVDFQRGMYHLKLGDLHICAKMKIVHRFRVG